MKIPIQGKIAELERRIMALEARHGLAVSHTTTTRTTQTIPAVDLEPGMGGLWSSFDALMAKAFGRFR